MLAGMLEGMDKVHAIDSLWDSFRAEVERVSTIIFLELILSIEQKTIKPANVGGVGQPLVYTRANHLTYDVSVM